MPEERKILKWTVWAQLAILVAMIGVRAIPLVTGQTVLVRVQPVDPRDLFRGDYVTLSYEFSRIPSQGIEGLSSTRWGYGSDQQGRTVYVPLVKEEDGVHWHAAKVTLDKPPMGPFLKGQVGRYGLMQFGIEAYYLQEGSGRMYEQALRNRKLSAELAVTSGGQAALRSLKIE
jgi:uncharacterized membrane-anchored protein